MINVKERLKACKWFLERSKKRYMPKPVICSVEVERELLEEIDRLYELLHDIRRVAEEPDPNGPWLPAGLLQRIDDVLGIGQSQEELP